MQSDAFLPQSETMLVAAGVAAASQACVFPGAGATAMNATANCVPPPNVLITNLGTAVVWVSITAQARVAAIPAAGNTSFEVPILPGTSQTFRAPWAQGSAGAEGTAGTQNLGGTPGTATLNVNTISATAGQQLAVTFGEGV